MAASSPSRALPRYLKATYLADGELLLRETRATKLYYFPGPILWLLVALGFDYLAASVRYPAWPPVPGLTSRFASLPAIAAKDPGSYLVIVSLLLTLVVVLWLLVRFLRWISNVYAVTSSRVILQRGIFGRDFDEIPIAQVRGVDVHQNVGQRILRYGSVQVSAEGGTGRSIGNEVWHGIPKPFEFQRLVENATQGLARNVGSGGFSSGR
ncbi:MAG TPA: PH domain-containing protein [Thermoplasmata archaeon]|nr:PH domain-containing protein [Thermoplasmata archaeon]